MRAGLGLAVAMAAVLPAAAQDTVKVEVYEQAGLRVQVYVFPFLDETELATLRLVATNAEAQALFLPEGGGHAAMAVAPAEGFIRSGAPVASAVAVGALPDAEAARAKALEGCEAARKKRPACEVVLTVAPLP
jgi:hypothetical protein